MKNKVFNLQVIFLCFILIGCGSDVPVSPPVDVPTMPPQDSGAGKNIKSRIPRQPGSQNQGK